MRLFIFTIFVTTSRLRSNYVESLWSIFHFHIFYYGYSYDNKNTDTLVILLIFLEYVPLFLDDNVDEEYE